jgi:hypothetical protein
MSTVIILGNGNSQKMHEQLRKQNKKEGTMHNKSHLRFTVISNSTFHPITFEGVCSLQAGFDFLKLAEWARGSLGYRCRCIRWKKRQSSPSIAEEVGGRVMLVQRSPNCLSHRRIPNTRWLNSQKLLSRLPPLEWTIKKIVMPSQRRRFPRSCLSNRTWSNGRVVMCWVCFIFYNSGAT